VVWAYDAGAALPFGRQTAVSLELGLMIDYRDDAKSAKKTADTRNEAPNQVNRAVSQSSHRIDVTLSSAGLRVLCDLRG